MQVEFDRDEQMNKKRNGLKQCGWLRLKKQILKSSAKC